MTVFLIGFGLILALLVGVMIGRKSSEPPSHDALGQELERWAQEERELPQRAHRAGEDAARRVDLRYPQSAQPSHRGSP